MCRKGPAPLPRFPWAHLTCWALSPWAVETNNTEEKGPVEVCAVLWSLRSHLEGRSVPTSSCSAPCSAKGGVQLVPRTGQVSQLRLPPSK